jgi:hypothetical protein
LFLASGTLEPIDAKVKTGGWKLRLKTKGVTDVAVTENRVRRAGTSAGTAIREPAW